MPTASGICSAEVSTKEIPMLSSANLDTLFGYPLAPTFFWPYSLLRMGGHAATQEDDEGLLS